MSGINKNIYFQEKVYNQLVEKIGVGKLSKFVNQAVEKELVEFEKNEKEMFNQQLIEGYKARAKDQELKKMLQTYGEMSWEDISTNLTLEEKKYESNKK